MKTLSKLKPAVTNAALLFLAAIVWDGVGVMLLCLAFSWLSSATGAGVYLYAVAGISLGLLVHHFGFLKIVDKNLERILQTNDRKCLFSFISWKSYLMILIMMAMGAVLRHSVLPKKNLAVLYIAIGLALILSSVRYIRIFFRERT